MNGFTSVSSFYGKMPQIQSSVSRINIPMNQKKVIIIGGGVVGLCTAYYLVKEGHEVTIIERDTILQGCSFGNAGMIVPSHFVPLATPGIIGQGVRWMLHAESPFYIRPRLNRRLINWGIKFYKAANTRQVQQAMPHLRNIGLFSRQLYQALQQDKELSNFGLKPSGLMMLYKTEKVAEEEIEVAHKANTLGIEAQVLNRKALHKIESEALPDVIGGVLYPGDAYLLPQVLLQSLKDYLQNKQVTIIENTQVENIVLNGQSVLGIETQNGLIKGDEYVLAAGIWSSDLAKKLRVRLPMQAGKGYSFMVADHPTQKIKTPSILCEAKVSVTPMQGQVRFGGTMEITGYDESINLKRVNGIAKAIPQYLPSYQVDLPKKSQVWHGLRPCSPDGLPYIGRIRQLNNVNIAAGHAMMGVSLAPATGKLIAENITHKALSIDIKAFSPERYN